MTTNDVSATAGHSLLWTRLEVGKSIGTDLFPFPSLFLPSTKSQLSSSLNLEIWRGAQNKKNGGWCSARTSPAETFLHVPLVGPTCPTDCFLTKLTITSPEMVGNISIILCQLLVEAILFAWFGFKMAVLCIRQIQNKYMALVVHCYTQYLVTMMKQAADSALCSPTPEYDDCPQYPSDVLSASVMQGPTHRHPCHGSPTTAASTCQPTFLTVSCMANIHIHYLKLQNQVFVAITDY